MEPYPLHATSKLTPATHAYSGVTETTHPGISLLKAKDNPNQKEKQMKKYYKMLFGTLGLSVLLVALLFLGGTLFMGSWIGGQSVDNENHTLERYAKHQMDAILSLSNGLLKDSHNLTEEQKRQVQKIADTAATYIWKIQTETESDYTTIEEIKARH